MPTVFVGIDVSQSTLDVAVVPNSFHQKFDNTQAGCRQIIQTLLPLADLPDDIRVVVESTGGLELPIAIACEEAGISVAVIKPERARYYAKATGQLAKTDAIDARMLARFAQNVELTIHPLPTEETRHFRDLLDRRHQLVEMRTMEANRLSTTGEKRAQRSIEKHIRWINVEIDKLETELDRRIAAKEQWKELDRILQSIPGIGGQVSRTLIGQLPELGQVDRSAIGNLVGLAPIANDSGTKEGKRYIIGGRKQVRNMLYMAAIVAIRHNPICKDLYTRLRAKGKEGKVAVIAVAHKLLTIANAMVRSKTTWRHPLVAKTA